MTVKQFIILISIYFTLSETSLAQALTEKNQPQCRCCQVGRFYAPWLKNLPKPKLRDFLGNAELKITTKSEKSQLYFNQGLNCLHGFWEVEAYRYFLAAVEEDPECAMAYWGICMSLPGKLTEAKEERDIAYQRAKELSKNLTEHEQLYISMLEQLLTLGSKAACVTLTEITEKFPNDLNAICYLAYWNQEGYQLNGQPKEPTIQSIKIIEKGLAINSNHIGLIHYYMHILEQGPDFMKIMPHLKKLTSKGKDISHLLHMPGHIYFLAGDYDKACIAFRECYNTEVNYFANEKLTPSDLPNYSHNLHFWAKTEAERGNYNEALRISNLLKKSIVNVARENTTISQNQYTLATLEAYIHMRFRKYTKASESLNITKYDEKTSLHHYVKFLKQYCNLKAEMMHTADWNKIYEISEELEEILNAFKQTRNQSETTKRENSRALAIMKIYNQAAQLWIFNVNKKENMDLSLAEILLEKESKMHYAEPPMLVRPMTEELGWLCLDFGENEKALSYFEKALKKRAKSGHIYSGMTEAYMKLGNQEKAAEYKKLVDAVWKQAN